MEHRRHDYFLTVSLCVWHNQLHFYIQNSTVALQLTSNIACYISWVIWYTHQHAIDTLGFSLSGTSWRRVAYMRNYFVG
jgi:hypothetical protein